MRELRVWRRELTLYSLASGISKWKNGIFYWECFFLPNDGIRKNKDTIVFLSPRCLVWYTWWTRKVSFEIWRDAKLTWWSELTRMGHDGWGHTSKCLEDTSWIWPFLCLYLLSLISNWRKIVGNLKWPQMNFTRLPAKCYTLFTMNGRRWHDFERIGLFRCIIKLKDSSITPLGEVSKLTWLQATDIKIRCMQVVGTAAQIH